MLQIPLFNRILIVLVVLAGLSFAMPNLFYERVERHNDAAAEIEATGVTSDENAAALAGWPEFLPSTLVNLGLDLRGGAHLLAEVAVEDVYEARMDSLWPEVRDALRDLRDTVGTIRRIDAPPGELHVRVSQPEGLPEAVAAVRALAQPVVSLTGVGASTLDVSGQGDTLIIALSEAERSATDDRTMQQSVEIVRRRVDEAGTREPTIQRQGADRILIQVPGIGRRRN
jgi:preprotein translocase subunit SecD